jgi:site-specific recombinase XerC
MPTTRPRHTITETPPVQEALDRLRAQMGSQKVDFGELVVLGAGEKERQLQRDSEAAREAREWLANEIRTGTHDPGEVARADEVKRLGLIADYE